MDTTKVKVFGISVGETDEIAQQFAQNFGLTFPVLRDANHTVYNSYPVAGISPYPRDCIVDQQGVIRYLRSEYDPQIMLDIVHQLVPTRIKEQEQVERVPQGLQLRVYPNPSNAQSTIQFKVSSASEINLKLYDLNGRTVYAENIKEGDAGEVKNVIIDLENYSSGIYFISLQNGRYSEVKKLVLAK